MTTTEQRPGIVFSIQRGVKSVVTGFLQGGIGKREAAVPPPPDRPFHEARADIAGQGDYWDKQLEAGNISPPTHAVYTTALRAAETRLIGDRLKASTEPKGS